MVEKLQAQSQGGLALIKNILVIFIGLGLLACSPAKEADAVVQDNTQIEVPSIIVLGTCQDAGSPQINCQKTCCAELHMDPDPMRMVVSLGLVDPEHSMKFIFEATPDFPQQIAMLESLANFGRGHLPDGVFLTHAHIGHYTGLMYLGNEAMDAKNVPVYVMPRMKSFLESNGPWQLLSERNNVELRLLEAGMGVSVTPSIKVTPLLVPHRDEYSETVGYRIVGPNKSALFIPDIDKWEKWEASIIDVLATVDYAFVDATFFDAAEMNNRDISEIPHPFASETIKLLNDLDPAEKVKVVFIHFNHTNRLLNPNSDEYKSTIESGFRVANVGAVYPL